MAASQSTKDSRSPETTSKRIHDLEFLLTPVIKHLSTCGSPSEEWQTIKTFIEEGFGQVLVSRNSSSTEDSDRIESHKDESMPELKSESASAQPSGSNELIELLQTLVDDPEKWLSTPTIQFGGRQPKDLLGTAEEGKLFDLLVAVEQGLF